LRSLDGYDEATGKYRALVLPTDGLNVAVTDTTLVVQPGRRLRSGQPRCPRPRRQCQEKTQLRSRPGPDTPADPRQDALLWEQAATARQVRI